MKQEIKTETVMGKIEIGKYYVDGEGFYKCVGKEENNFNKYVRMDAVITQYKNLSYYHGISYVEEACERRMVECSEEDYNYVLGQVITICNKMHEYNTKIFTPLWRHRDRR
jgi:hypothetical protein